MKVLNNYDTIKRLLESDPKYRDDYNKLVARVWWIEVNKNKLLTAYEMLNRLARKELSHPESIMRARRKVQEEHPHLRGTTYHQRKTTEQKQVQTELGYII
jgi:hypothetical protein